MADAMDEKTSLRSAEGIPEDRLFSLDGSECVLTLTLSPMNQIFLSTKLNNPKSFIKVSRAVATNQTSVSIGAG